MRAALTRLTSGHHGRIAFDMSAIFLFVLLAKVAAAAKEMAVAWRYGTAPVVDAYLLAFNIVGIPIAVWYSVMMVVFIPLSARLAAEGGHQESMFRSQLAGATLLLSLVAAAVMWVAMRLVLAASSLGLDPGTHALAIRATDWLVLLIPLVSLANYGSVLLMAGRRHLNSLLEGAPAIGLMLVVILWPGGLAPLIVGTLLGAGLHLGLTVAALRHRRILPVPRFGFSAPPWKDFGAGMGTMLAAQTMLALTVIVDQLFAADLGSGSIATLGYAGRIVSLFLTLGAASIARAMLPVFSHIRHSDERSLPRVAVRWTGLSLLAGLVAAVVGWIGAEWMVRLLFERGAFTAQDTARVAEILRWGLLQTPFYFAITAAQQALFSFTRYRLAATLAGISLVVKVLLSFWLVPEYGLVGLMVSTAAMYAISCAGMVYALVRMGRARTA